MGRAEVVDRPDQIQPRRQGGGPPRQVATAPPQTRQMLAERRIQPLMRHVVCRVETRAAERDLARVGLRRAHEVLEATRTSPSNRRIVVFGISEGKPLGLQFSKYGINTLLEQPIDKQKALKAVRSAHLLIIHELRRYVRIPLVVPVRVDLDHGRRLDALTNEISAGGMSLTARDPFPKMSNVQVTFTLPQSKKTTITAALCWRREQENMVGIRFDLADDNRFLVRKWIDDFLDTD